MSWIEAHQLSERLASEAEVALRETRIEQALTLYAQAADAEEVGLAELDRSKTRTLGVSAVSAASLRYKARQYDRAEATASKWLGSGELPEFALEQLRHLLQSIWNEAAWDKAGVRFSSGQVLVSVKGGEVVKGGAPLDLIVEKVQTVQSLFYRTAELLKGLPHRKRGGPSNDIRAAFRPWLFQAPAGSYQFAVAVQEPQQSHLFEKPSPSAKEIAHRFFSILRASVDNPDEALPDLVADREYRTTFLQLTRNLAPTGKTFRQMEVRSTDEVHPITLVTATRTLVGEAIRKSSPERVEPASHRIETIRGILRAVHLDQDWLEVTVIDGSHIRVTKVGDAVDDVIGPMVNRPVVLQVARDHRDHLLFRDIEPED